MLKLASCCSFFNGTQKPWAGGPSCQSAVPLRDFEMVQALRFDCLSLITRPSAKQQHAHTLPPSDGRLSWPPPINPPVKFTDGIEGIFGIWQVRVYTCRDSRLQWCVVEVVAVLLLKALWWTRPARFWRFWLYANPTKCMNLCVCVCSTVAKINNQRLTEHTVSRQNWEVLLCVFARQMLEDSRAADEAFQTGDGLQNGLSNFICSDMQTFVGFSTWTVTVALIDSLYASSTQLKGDYLTRFQDLFPENIIWDKFVI